jgi:type VI secretion system protein ImpA
MPLRDDLLNPIPGDNPAGADLRYDPVYKAIQEARREDEDIPTGGWDRPRKLADWPQVLKLAGNALAQSSKDLWLAAWFTEAMLRTEGYGGLAAGLTLLRGLLDRFWDGCHPGIEDGDLGLRAAPLEWLGSRLDLSVKSVPLTGGGFDYWKYREARAIPTQEEADQDAAKATARQAALDDKKLLPEQFEKSFRDTPKPWFRQLAGDLNAAQAALESLDELCRERFGDDSPSLLPLRESIEEVLRAAQQLLDRKLVQDPDAAARAPAASPVTAAPGAPPSGATGFPPIAEPPGPLALEATDSADAPSRVVEAAHVLRRGDPTSPASYLILRAMRWGELRAQSPRPDPRLLEAPDVQTRTRLKTLMLDSDWPGLLETAETVMGTPAGRGWLDLQRYVLIALEAMGPEYERAARAVRRELKTLLEEIPGLAQTTLMDDLPTAGGSTLAWLRSDGLLGDAAEPRPVEVSRPSAARPAPEADRTLDRALAEVKAGRTSNAIAILKRELDRETSERGRFLRQVQLARVMVEAGLRAVATPTLQRLVAQIDQHKLEDWEEGSLVARPLALLYRCLEASGEDPETRQALYLRICQLDPVQAIRFGPAKGDGESGA